MLSMGKAERVTVEVSLAKVGLPATEAVRVWLVKPLEAEAMTDLGMLTPADGVLDVSAPITPGWSGLTLVVLGEEGPRLGVLPAGKE